MSDRRMTNRSPRTVQLEDQLLATLAEHGALTSTELAALNSTEGRGIRADRLDPCLFSWGITRIMARLARDGRCGRVDLGREAVWITTETTP